MKLKGRRYIPDIITAVIYLSVGTALRFYTDKFLKYSYYTFAVVLIISAVKSVYYFVARKSGFSMAESLADFILAWLFVMRPFPVSHLIGFVCSLYFVILAAVHLIAFFNGISDGAGRKYGLFIVGISEIYISFRLFSGSSYGIVYLGRLLGMHLIVYAAAIIQDMLCSLLVPGKTRKKRIHISLPNIICAFIPRRILTSVNRFLRTDSNSAEMINKKKNDECSLEIFIHMADTFFGHVGHIDMCIHGKVISYGSYDESSYRFKGMIGDGVVEIIDRGKYIGFCLEEAGKHIVSFGIKLTDNEQEKLRNKLEEIFDNLTPWEPPVAVNERNHIKSVQYELDYASALYKKTGAEFFKFRDGPYSKFRTYFGLFTNCATLAEEITSSVGINLFDFSGILTPGTFYDYLNREYNRNSDFVISRNLYAMPENAK